MYFYNVVFNSRPLSYLPFILYIFNSCAAWLPGVHLLGFYGIQSGKHAPYVSFFTRGVDVDPGYSLLYFRIILFSSLDLSF